MPKFEKLSHNNLCSGAAHELFEREMDAVMANVSDINTDPKAKRVITLTVELKPKSDRGSADVSIKCSSKVAPVKVVEGTVECGQAAGKATAYAKVETPEDALPANVVGGSF